MGVNLGGLGLDLRFRLEVAQGHDHSITWWQRSLDGSVVFHQELGILFGREAELWGDSPHPTAEEVLREGLQKPRASLGPGVWSRRPPLIPLGWGPFPCPASLHLPRTRPGVGGGGSKVLFSTLQGNLCPGPVYNFLNFKARRSGQIFAFHFKPASHFGRTV